MNSSKGHSSSMYSNNTKYVVVIGGIMSGIGKGITASSIGLLLKGRGLKISAIKIDPYINVDAGTMSPFEHGETYVLKDGGECDLDLGNYERFLNIELTRDHNITTGKIYRKVIEKERRGEYLGQTVQSNPHIINEIIDHIERVTKKSECDVMMIELGGTVGDKEIAIYIDSLLQLSKKEGSDVCFVYLSMLLTSGKELKTKPLQDSVAKLRSFGIFPDILCVRTPVDIPAEIAKKTSTMCHVSQDRIISNTDVYNIYLVPNKLREENIVDRISEVIDLGLSTDYSLEEYQKILDYYSSEKKTITILIAGKYIGSNDTYLSLIRAINHAGFETGLEIKTKWLDTTDQLKVHKAFSNPQKIDFDAVIIPGGFGQKGIMGKILVACYCRTNGIPMLGICLGMQVMVIEYARYAVKEYGDGSCSEEWFESSDENISRNREKAVVGILEGQCKDKIGGTMRLGNYTTALSRGSRVRELYGCRVITERHRHRYEILPKFVKELEKGTLTIEDPSEYNTLKVSGINASSTTSENGDEKICETIEVENHPFYIGCQYHPEFRSRFSDPHPLFVGLARAALYRINSTS